MIKSSELMIGDYVLVDGAPRRVESITKKKIGYHFNPQTARRLHYAKLHDVEPIEITKELLKENGFIDNLCYLDYHLDEQSRIQYYRHEHRLSKIWYGRDEWQNNAHVREESFRCNCFYFHELQQACKMCGVNISWKI